MTDLLQRLKDARQRGEAAAAEFLALARRHGAPLEAGQWIASGGLNPAVAIKPGDSLRFAALGGEVRLEIR
ncbi:MAG: hypothetical protein ACLFRU_01710 [Paracoccaceae bacterium]